MNPLDFTRENWINLGISVAIIVLAIALGRWLISIVLDRILSRFTGRTDTKLDDLVIEAARKPAYWFAVIFAFQTALRRLTFLLPEDSPRLFNDTFYVLYIVAGFILVWRLVSTLFEWYGSEVAINTDTDLDEQLLPFFRRITLIVLGVIGLITLLGYFDVEVSGLVTTLGIGSLAVALAAQAALEDTISGFLIMTDRPYRINDRIEVLDLDTWGDVVDIGLRSTRIRTIDNRMVVVPNSVIGKSLVVNHSYPDNRYRIEVPVGVAYGSDLELARRVMEDAVRKVDTVLPDKPVEAHFWEFGDNALIFHVRWWIESYIDYYQMFDRVNTAIYNALNDADIGIPFPQRDVWHKIDPSDAAIITRVISGKNGR